MKNRAPMRPGVQPRPGLRMVVAFFGLALLSDCKSMPTPTPDPHAELVEKGRDLFFNETFNGNGRTCGTCHRAENNLTIDPAFIATLPGDDPLFVAEFIPALKKNFENQKLMREFGLIVENLDGFGDLENTFTMRGVPHTLALPTSITRCPKAIVWRNQFSSEIGRLIRKILNSRVKV